MALYPTKVLLDKNKKPFIPFVTAESILFNNTDKSLADMLYNRYTKEEVDNIIRNLGTIQVLRGRLDTYEDLLAIENPQAGDVYIVGTSNTNNTEYIYIGTTWEELGPMVDLSNLVTIDDLIARLGVYATIEYVDSLIGNVPSLKAPYIELTGTASEPVVIGTLDTGFYLIHGVYDTGSSVINASATGDLLQVGVWNTSTNTRTVIQMKSVNGTYSVYKIDRTFEVTVVASDNTTYNATFKIKPEYSSTLKSKIEQYADKLQKIYDYLEAHPTMYSSTSNINDGNYQWVVDMNTIDSNSVTVYLGYLAAGSRTSQTGGGYSVQKNHGFSIIAQCYGTNSGRLRVWAGTEPSYSAYPPSGTSNLKKVTISFSDGNITGYSGPTSHSSSIVWIDQTIAEGDAGRTVVAYVNQFYFLPNPVTAYMYHQRMRIKHTGWDVNTYAEYDVPINLNGKVYWGTEGDGPDYYNQTIPYSLFRQCLQTPYDPTTYNYLSTEGQMVTTLSHTIPTNLVNGTATNSIKNKNNTSTPGSYSTALANATASGNYSLASGRGSQATGGESVALGYYAKATGGQSFAANRGTASGSYSHASGYNTTASGSYSSVAGYGAQATESYAHAHGYYAKANASAAHAEGSYTEANGTYSHAEGYYTVAGSTQQHVQGKYNIADTESVYAHIVGNGTSSTRSNAHTLDWNGNAWYAGTVQASDPVAAADLTTKNYVDGQITNIDERINNIELPDIDTSTLVSREEHNEDMTSRPTFEQARSMIDESIEDAKDTRVLKFVGHFEDKNSLPFAGQESAAITNDYDTTLTTDLSNAEFDINKIRAIVTEPYFIGMYVSDTEYTLIGFTDKDSLELIKFRRWRTNETSQVTNIPTIGIRIKGSAANPIKVYSYRASLGSEIPTYVAWRFMDGNTKRQNTTPRSFTEEMEFFIQDSPNLCSNVTGKIFNWIEDNYGFLYAYYSGDDRPNGVVAKTSAELVLQFENNFAFAYNMAMLKFGSDCQPMWLTTEGECEINDVASYGEQGDHCRFNGEAWAPVGMPSEDILKNASRSAISAVYDPSVVEASGNWTLTESNVSTDYPINSVLSQIGTGLTLDAENNCITVGEGVSAVLVFAKITYVTNESGTDKTWATYITNNLNNYSQATFTPSVGVHNNINNSVMLNVSAGDQIRMPFYGQAGDHVGRSTNTVLTVVQIA